MQVPSRGTSGTRLAGIVKWGPGLRDTRGIRHRPGIRRVPIPAISTPPRSVLVHGTRNHPVQPTLEANDDEVLVVGNGQEDVADGTAPLAKVQPHQLVLVADTQCELPIVALQIATQASGQGGATEIPVSRGPENAELDPPDVAEIGTGSPRVRVINEAHDQPRELK